MFMTNNNSKQQQEILLMINHIVRELIVEFGKDENEAMELVENSQVEKSLAENPIGFHESAYDWAVSVLADNNDIETLEKYLHH
ncbi:hypothetical protein [Bacillus sp. FJAT-42315]|uniref:hypothetical protein n=1 Tax=Bacillus sp. FJAT-42315 TaxID=2014077 RepID=UPI000C24ABE6|nr:hypothetical protein [Bacillus sp. FJAT-42315]